MQSMAPSSNGTLLAEIMAETFDARRISRRWPIRPKPVMSVIEWTAKPAFGFRLPRLALLGGADEGVRPYAVCNHCVIRDYFCGFFVQRRHRGDSCVNPG